ncbi:phosphotransferase, partial [Hyalangium sp.]|uniref:phosphotransferase n=1 Tax=Hyalangium sp. TaxID=2028555 RepID=UPI002D48B517
EDRIAAVIDWEDAAVGDPLSDLACSRVELMCAYGEAAMEAFTAHYLRARGQAVDSEELALWELLVSSAALALMDRWGLEPRLEAARRSKTRVFLDRAAATLSRRDGR